MTPRDETWWPAGTLEERMNHGGDLAESGTPDEMRAKALAWKAEHQRALREAGLVPPPEDDDDVSDLDAYDLRLQETPP